MNAVKNTPFTRILIRALVLIVFTAAIFISASRPVQGYAEHPVLAQVNSVDALKNPPFRPLNNGTVRASLVQVKFLRDSLYVVARFNANNLRGERIRMALFFYWANGAPLEPNPDTVASDYITSDGNLTQQYVDEALYANTEWSNVEFTIPYMYFPPVTQVSNVFLMAAIGIDGQDFVGRSYRQYFVLNP